MNGVVQFPNVIILQDNLFQLSYKNLLTEPNSYTIESNTDFKLKITRRETSRKA